MISPASTCLNCELPAVATGGPSLESETEDEERQDMRTTIRLNNGTKMPGIRIGLGQHS